MATTDAMVTRALHALSEAFVRLYNAEEIDSLVATCYSEDAHLLPPNHPPVRGRAQMHHFFAGLRASGMGDLAAATLHRWRCLATSPTAWGRMRLARSRSLEGPSWKCTAGRQTGPGTWSRICLRACR